MPSRHKRVAVVGVVGIPASYGGFETLAEQISRRLSSQFDLTVYCSKQAYAERSRVVEGVTRRFLPLKANGFQSIPYDAWSMFDAAIRGVDTLVVLGTSGATALPFLRSFWRGRIVLNVDGMEWQRPKWRPAVRTFLRWSERVAVRRADIVIADNEVIRDYLASAYGVKARLIEYGGDHARTFPATSKMELPVDSDRYALSICRIEPENNIGLILEAFQELPEWPLVIVGNWDASEYGRALRSRFEAAPNIRCVSPIYDAAVLSGLRARCAVYVHGHSAGGTNPSLVEAMSAGLPVMAYDVAYNRATTEWRAAFFKTAAELRALLQSVDVDELSSIGSALAGVAARRYTWDRIAAEYAALL